MIDSTAGYTYYYSAYTDEVIGTGFATNSAVNSAVIVADAA